MQHFLGRTWEGRFLEVVLREDCKERGMYKVQQLLGKWTENISSCCEKGWTFVEKHRDKTKTLLFSGCVKSSFTGFDILLRKTFWQIPCSALWREMRGQREQRCQGPAKPLQGSNNREPQRHHQEKWGQWYLWPTGWFSPRFFSLDLRNHLKSSLFCILIGEWEKGTPSNFSSHSNTLQSKPTLWDSSLNSHTRRCDVSQENKKQKGNDQVLGSLRHETWRSNTQLRGELNRLLFAAESPITKATLWKGQV